MDNPTLNPFAKAVIRAFEAKPSSHPGQKINVNPIISKLASWYEKLRNAMDYREEEVILRAAIERILKRRLMLSSKGKTIAGPLIRELIWARYFPDGSLAESVIEKVADIIDTYILLKNKILEKHKYKEDQLHKLIIQLMSSHIENFLNPHKEKEVLSNFFYQIINKNITITDDTEDTKNAQVFIAVRRAFAKDDPAFLNYHLYLQYFGSINKENIDQVAEKFQEASRTIEEQLNYPLSLRFYIYVKKITPPMFILEDLLKKNKDNIHALLEDQTELDNMVMELCQARYKTISSTVRRAIIRSIIFILLSKTFFALGIEGTYENMIYGKILWSSIALNVLIPPILMAIAGFFIRTPDRNNSLRILGAIKVLLFDEKPTIGHTIKLKKNKDRNISILSIIFSFLWFFAFLLSFGLIVYILSKLHFNLISQGVFIFFLAIVAFLTYRIYRIAHTYSFEGRPGIFAPIVDLLFMPIAQVGRYLTEGIAQINIFIFILDFIFEAPFKGIFGFFEQWFSYLYAKRENLE